MPNTLLSSKRIVITAGPTREAIDPVRFISNHSSGKMGYALAELLHDLGADVHVVSGPVQINSLLPAALIIHVTTADEMLTATKQLAESADIIVFAAAVGDYKCAHVAQQKIKKSGETLQLDLVPNPDIAFEISKIKKSHQLFVGFALETEHGKENAIVKMQRKKFDCIVLNMQNEYGSGFGHDTNKIQILDSDLKVTAFELKLKSLVALDIVNHIKDMLAKNN